ncbi:MAG TPA: hypothetical protein VNS53_01255 [Sphingomicrobium sp.]|nr:hypothetical protein [Sphingomicrobium sp.]
MKRRSELADLFVPWAGLAVGIVAAAIVHQFGSEGVFNHCKPISPIPLIVVALIGIAVTVMAGLASWRVIRGEEETPARKVVAVVSVGSAALFVFSMILPIIASLVLPPCFQ